MEMQETELGDGDADADGDKRWELHGRDEVRRGYGTREAVMRLIGGVQERGCTKEDECDEQDGMQRDKRHKNGIATGLNKVPRTGIQALLMVQR